MDAPGDGPDLIGSIRHPLQSEPAGGTEDGQQDAAAGALLDYLTHRRDLRVSDEQLAEIRRRRADPNRKLVSHEEARARIKRLGA